MPSNIQSFLFLKNILSLVSWNRYKNQSTEGAEFVWDSESQEVKVVRFVFV
jgi:hypothetical protein